MSKPSQPSGEAAGQRDQDMSQTESGEAPSRPSDKETRHVRARRRVLQSIAAGGATITVKALPEQWAEPVLNTAVLPAHAQSTCQAESLNCAVNSIELATDGDPDTSIPGTPITGGNSATIDQFFDFNDTTCPPTVGGGRVDQVSLTVTATVNPPCEPVNLVATIPASDEYHIDGGGAQTGVVNLTTGAVTFNNVVVGVDLVPTTGDVEATGTLDITISAPGISTDCVIDITFTERVGCVG